MKKILLVSSLLLLSMSCKRLIRYEYELKGVAEEGRREVFEKSRAYNAGKEQDLADYYGQYQLANDEDKKAIRGAIQMIFADYDDRNMNNVKLKQFLNEMRYGKEW